MAHSHCIGLAVCRCRLNLGNLQTFNINRLQTSGDGNGDCPTDTCGETIGAVVALFATEFGIFIGKCATKQSDIEPFFTGYLNEILAGAGLVSLTNACHQLNQVGVHLYAVKGTGCTIKVDSVRVLQ